MLVDINEIASLPGIDASSRVLDAADIHRQRATPVVAARSTEPTLSAVIPTLNEAGNIEAIVSALPSCVSEIVVVDGRSSDGTALLALNADPRVRVVMERRRGKGVAMLSGFAAATQDAIVALDADGSMDPAEIAMFRAVLGCNYDLVKGSREAVGGESEDFSLLRRFGNGTLTRLANALYRTGWSDMCYGYFAFWRDVLPAIDLRWATLTTRALEHELSREFSVLKPRVGTGDAMAYGNGFEIETVLFLRAARAGLRIAETPSREFPRLEGESNLRTFRDGSRVLAAIARERLRRGSHPGQRSAPVWTGAVDATAVAS